MCSLLRQKYTKAIKSKIQLISINYYLLLAWWVNEITYDRWMKLNYYISFGMLSCMVFKSGRKWSRRVKINRKAYSATMRTFGTMEHSNKCWKKRRCCLNKHKDPLHFLLRTNNQYPVHMLHTPNTQNCGFILTAMGHFEHFSPRFHEKKNCFRIIHSNEFQRKMCIDSIKEYAICKRIHNMLLYVYIDTFTILNTMIIGVWYNFHPHKFNVYNLWCAVCTCRCVWVLPIIMTGWQNWAKTSNQNRNLQQQKFFFWNWVMWSNLCKKKTRWKLCAI